MQWLGALWGSVAAHQLCDFGKSSSQTPSACPSAVCPPLCPAGSVCGLYQDATTLFECSCWIHGMGGASRWEEGEEGV